MKQKARLREKTRQAAFHDDPEKPLAVSIVDMGDGTGVKTELWPDGYRVYIGTIESGVFTATSVRFRPFSQPPTPSPADIDSTKQD